jgi:hypothetical protein
MVEEKRLSCQRVTVTLLESDRFGSVECSITIMFDDILCRRCVCGRYILSF